MLNQPHPPFPSLSHVFIPFFSFKRMRASLGPLRGARRVERVREQTPPPLPKAWWRGLGAACHTMPRLPRILPFYPTFIIHFIFHISFFIPVFYFSFLLLLEKTPASPLLIAAPIKLQYVTP